MNFLHYQFNLAPSDAVEITLDKQANVRLLDDSNFSLFRNGQTHRYIGGLAKESPVILSAPRSGHWNVVVDLGGYSGTVQASARILKGVG